MKTFRIVVLALTALLAAPGLAQTKPVPAQATTSATDMQILRQKIKADKKLVIAANMQLTEAEAEGFWPVYEAYQKDLASINDRLGKLVLSYAEAYNKGPVSDEVAKELISEAIAVDEVEAKLKRSYLPRLEKVIPGMKVARYFQIESKVRAIVRYELATNIPLVE